MAAVSELDCVEHLPAQMPLMRVLFCEKRMQVMVVILPVLRHGYCADHSSSLL